MSQEKARDYRKSMAALLHAYRILTSRPDTILARLGLARVHHRILFFVASQRGLSVKELLSALGVTKQALHLPIRQLIDMGLVESHPDSKDKRIKRLQLTTAGELLEAELHREQASLLQEAFDQAGAEAVRGWSAVCQALTDDE